jgi:hypothetical protein
MVWADILVPVIPLVTFKDVSVVLPVTTKLLLIVVKPDILNEFCKLVLLVIVTILLNKLVPVIIKLELILIEFPVENKFPVYTSHPMDTISCEAPDHVIFFVTGLLGSVDTSTIGNTSLPSGLFPCNGSCEILIFVILY